MKKSLLISFLFIGALFAESDVVVTNNNVIVDSDNGVVAIYGEDGAWFNSTKVNIKESAYSQNKIYRKYPLMETQSRGMGIEKPSIYIVTPYVHNY